MELADHLAKEEARKSQELAEAKMIQQAKEIADGLAREEKVSRAQEIAEARKIIEAMELADRLAKEEARKA